MECVRGGGQAHLHANDVGQVLQLLQDLSRASLWPADSPEPSNSHTAVMSRACQGLQGLSVYTVWMRQTSAWATHQRECIVPPIHDLAQTKG